MLGRSLVLISLVAVFAGCPRNGGTKLRLDDKVPDIAARLAKQRAAMTALRADATMDYFVGKQRAKGEVLVIASTGKHVRFAGLSPAGGNPILEMACDGESYTLVDYQNNCTLSGPCDKDAIARFFGIELEPDDLIHLALGTPPLIDETAGTVTWDAKCGCQRVELKTAAQTERITIDGRDGRRDVIDAELLDGAGKTLWRVDNKDFVDVTDPAGAKYRVPGKQRFKSPAREEDLIVDWGAVKDRAVNPELKPEQFKLEAPQGLPMCPPPP